MRSIALARALGVLALLALISQLGCAKAPPHLTPDGQKAFYKTRVIKTIDLARDFAIDGEATTPKVVSTDTARQVVTWHRSTLLTIQASDAGWQAAVDKALTELQANLSESDRAKFAPYIVLARVTLKEVLQ